MTERERIIEGLIDIVADLSPFAGDHEDWMKVHRAIKYLKEQEPRVLTLEEAFRLQEEYPYPCIFVEIKGRFDVFLGSFADKIYGDYHSDEIKVYRPWMGAERKYHKSEYMKAIRFWDRFPTEEQRKAVKWNETD